MNKETYLKIFNHFGWYEQRRKLQEELDELKDEILLLNTVSVILKKRLKKWQM